jgi:hypothetical protein
MRVCGPGAMPKKVCLITEADYARPTVRVGADVCAVRLSV